MNSSLRVFIRSVSDRGNGIRIDPQFETVQKQNRVSFKSIEGGECSVDLKPIK